MIKRLLFFILLLLTISADAQNKNERRFRAGVTLGFNATQIDGDDIGGFKKFGLNGGGVVHMVFEDRYSASISMLYSQKGAKSSLSSNGGTIFREIILDYVDIPIQFNYHDKDIAIFSGGVMLGRVVRYRQFVEGQPVHVTDPNPYYDWNLGVVLNATFLIKERYGVNMHFQYSILSLGEEFAESNLKNKGQYHNILGLRGLYYIN